MEPPKLENKKEKKAKSKEPRIGAAEIAVLLFFAVFMDILSLIPIANDVVDIVAQSLIAVFFFVNGVNIFTGGYKKLVPYIVGWIVEAIPVVSVFPTITIETIIIIIISRIEDRTGISSSSASEKLIKA